MCPEAKDALTDEAAEKLLTLHADESANSEREEERATGQCDCAGRYALREELAAIHGQTSAERVSGESANGDSERAFVASKSDGGYLAAVAELSTESEEKGFRKSSSTELAQEIFGGGNSGGKATAGVGLILNRAILIEFTFDFAHFFMLRLGALEAKVQEAKAKDEVKNASELADGGAVENGGGEHAESGREDCHQHKGKKAAGEYLVPAIAHGENGSSDEGLIANLGYNHHAKRMHQPTIPRHRWQPTPRKSFLPVG